MDPAVFEDTPLSRYLHESESNDGFSLEEDSGIGTTNHRLPPERHIGDVTTETSRKRQRDLIPLELDANGMSLILQKKRFKALVKDALRGKLNNHENLMFLEQFRYILVSSQLLEPKTRGFSHKSLVAKQETARVLKEARRTRMLLEKGGPWSLLRIDDRYWAGRGGGSVILLAVILTLGSKKNDLVSSVRKTCLSVVGISIVLYLFAYSRRKMLRVLRAKVVAHASVFTEANHDLDHAITRCIALIREVELLSRGYRPDLATAADKPLPATRIETAHHTRQVRSAKSLRSAVCAVLYLAMDSLEDSIREVLPLCNILDLSRYFDMYDMPESQRQFGISVSEDNTATTKGQLVFSCELTKHRYYGSQAANSPLADIQYELQKLHCMRRTLICCLLVVSTSGECSSQEFDSWGTVLDTLDQTSALIHQLSESLGRENLLHKTVQEVGDGAKELPTEVSSLMDSLQHIDSRLEILKERINYKHNYELLGEDIEALYKQWKDGLQRLEPEPEPEPEPVTTPQLSCGQPSFMDLDQQSMASTMVDDTDTLVEYPYRMVSPREESGKQEPSVYEAVAELCGGKQTSALTREQRIKLKNEARAQEMSRQRSRDAQVDFLAELGGVLQGRSTI